MFDEKLSRVKALIEQREKIDAELKAMLNIEERQRKCSRCGSTEHTARNCDKPQE